MQRIDVARLGKAIREKRSAEDKNQSYVAERVGVAQGVVSRIENGYGGIDGDLYVKCCTWLGVPFETFLVEAALDPAA